MNQTFVNQNFVNLTFVNQKRWFHSQKVHIIQVHKIQVHKIQVHVNLRLVVEKISNVVFLSSKTSDELPIKDITGRRKVNFRIGGIDVTTGTG
jgi:hypothetical protein